MRIDPQMKLPNMGETLAEKVEKSIALLQAMEPKALELGPEHGYFLGFSGGKDSVVIKRLADMAGVKYKARYSVTTIDPPELLAFIREHHPEVEWLRQDKAMMTRVVEKGLPTRIMRWCCAEYKEQGGDGLVKMFGIRAAESPRRRIQWQHITAWRKGEGVAVNPILLWSDSDVWEFIKAEGIPYCKLYNEGMERLGCIGCPMARKRGREAEFERWPRYRKLWLNAARKLWDRRAGSTLRDGREWFGSAKFKDADEMFEWWISDESLPQDDDGCQGQEPELF
jgi:phosphoadenosine phosphosulfate reductase